RRYGNRRRDGDRPRGPLPRDRSDRRYHRRRQCVAGVDHREYPPRPGPARRVGRAGPPRLQSPSGPAAARGAARPRRERLGPAGAPALAGRPWQTFGAGDDRRRGYGVAGGDCRRLRRPIDQPGGRARARAGVARRLATRRRDGRRARYCRAAWQRHPPCRVQHLRRSGGSGASLRGLPAHAGRPRRDRTNKSRARLLGRAGGAGGAGGATRAWRQRRPVRRGPGRCAPARPPGGRRGHRAFPVRDAARDPYGGNGCGRDRRTRHPGRARGWAAPRLRRRRRAALPRPLFRDARPDECGTRSAERGI
ncbi:MAG: Inosine-uridine preferring nucleoside hydrolase, partial [uncultured Thermomicrobiales bacterium]